MKKQIAKFWRHYIKGEYHCDTCPCGWSEYSPGCDEWDAGCVIKGEISEGACRLMPPLRTLLGWVKVRQRNFYLAHEYDDYPAYIEKEQREVDCLKEGIMQHLLLSADLYYTTDLPGEYKPLDDDRIEDLLYCVWELRHQYENTAHPYAYKTIQEERRELLAKTVRRIFIEPFLPFLPPKIKKLKFKEAHHDSGFHYGKT